MLEKYRRLINLQTIFKSNLYKNSFYIIITSGLTAFLGFVFWIIAAKFYSAEDMGTATALISSSSLIVIVSGFGLDSSLTRFFNLYDKNKIINTYLTISVFSSIIISFFYIVFINFLSPKLFFLRIPYYSLIYIVFLIAQCIMSTSTTAFIVSRKGEFQFIQNLITGLRILFLFSLINFGAMGIFSSLGLSFIIASLASYYLLRKINVILKLNIDYKFVTDSYKFSFDNYLLTIFTTAPTLILPIMVLNVLGSHYAAYYYVAFALVSLLFIIPTAISMSLFVEGSHGEPLKNTMIKSLRSTFLLLIPAIIIIYLFSNFLLGLIGKEYSYESAQLLKIMSISSLFIAINYIYYSVKKVQKDMKIVLFINGAVCVLLLIFSYFFMKIFGIIGLGYSWIFANLIGVILIISVEFRYLKRLFHTI